MGPCIFMWNFRDIAKLSGWFFPKFDLPVALRTASAEPGKISPHDLK
jgi:hypothetical protein